MKKITAQLKLTAYSFITALLCGINVTLAQTTDTIASKEISHKNIVKLNISAPIIYNNAIMGTYERILSSHRSFSIYGGYCEFPSPSIIADNENLKFINNKQKSGFAIGADYRFYLAKENKYAAPRGVYLAPFISYYSFTNTRDIRYDTGGVTQQPILEGKFGASFFNAGACLGYQFLIKERFAIDLVMFGPSFTAYKFKAALVGDIDPADLTQAQIDIINALKERFPLLNDVSKSEGVSTSGISKFGAIGFRYSISIGYRF